MNKEEFNKMRYQDNLKRYGLETLREYRKAWASNLTEDQKKAKRLERNAYMREYNRKNKSLTAQ